MITISSKDAGGAEILSSWVLNNPGKYKYYLSGPAIKIFKSKIKKLKISNLSQCIDFSDTILSSTGTSSFEIKAINKFKQSNKKTIAYLDHWFNYKQRFLINGRFIKVDEIWVNDDQAFKEAKKYFSDTIIKRKKNYFLIDLIKETQNCKKKKNSVLYLADSKKNLKNKKNIELSIFKSFLKNIYFKKYFKKNIKLIIRVHPNEDPNKYKKIIKRNNLIEISKEKLPIDISQSLYIYGNNSMVLYLASQAGVKNSYNLVINKDYKYQRIMKKFKIKACNVRI